jgi:heme exporter protein CcmD
MTHWPYIAAAYGLSAVVIAWLVADAALRTGRARRRLASVDPRTDRDP